MADSCKSGLGLEGQKHESAMSSKHHKYGPSSLERRWLCPASARLEEGLPDTENEYSAEGTLLHEAVANRSMIGLTMTQIDSVQYAIDYESIIPEGSKVHHERRLRLINPKGQVISAGTADCVAANLELNMGWVLDDKFGWNRVEEPANNWQLAAYSAMSMQLFGINTIHAHVVYPRLKRSSNFTFFGYAEIVSKIEEVIARCEDANAPCVPGEKQCRYCKAAVYGKCPAQRSKFEIDVVQSESAISLRPISELTNDEAADLYCKYKTKVDLLNKFWKALSDDIKKRVSKDGFCGRIAMSKSHNQRSVRDILKAYDILSPHISRDEFLSCANISITKLETLFDEKVRGKAKEEGNKITKKQSQEMFSSLLEDEIILKPVEGRLEIDNE